MNGTRRHNHRVLGGFVGLDIVTQLAIVALIVVVLTAIFAPWLASQSPTFLNPGARFQHPSALHWLGTDSFGRDLYSRVIYGSRVSLVVGAGVVVISLVIGVLCGALAGFYRFLDGPIMRIMDGVMAIPAILLAIAMVVVSGASMTTVIIAISVPEVPRVARVVRSVVLACKHESYVEAARTLGTRPLRVIVTDILPNTMPVLIVQETYIFADAILSSALLSFLGAGIPPEIPSWGNIAAEGSSYFQLIPGLIVYPGIMLSVTILSINIIGDAFRDYLDPKLAANR